MSERGDMYLICGQQSFHSSLNVVRPTCLFSVSLHDVTYAECSKVLLPADGRNTEWFFTFGWGRPNSSVKYFQCLPVNPWIGYWRFLQRHVLGLPLFNTWRFDVRNSCRRNIAYLQRYCDVIIFMSRRYLLAWRNSFVSNHQKLRITNCIFNNWQNNCEKRESVRKF